MNGFKFSILSCILLLVSCNNRYIREHEGEALFLLYRGIPQRITTDKLSYWSSPAEFISQERRHIPDNKILMLELFDTNYAVLRMGNFRDAYEIESMSYHNAGSKLNIILTNGDNNMGYPIFVQKKTIKQISIYTNGVEIYFTNLH